MDIFLGEPPANIKAWIIEHYNPGPAGHADTIFTLQGGTVETHDITGTLDQQWMIDNGYWDEVEGEWIKTITQADIGNTVTSIQDNAFSVCFSLSSVAIPSSVLTIQTGAFNSCNGLISMTIPNSVSSIGDDTFSGCNRLTSVTFPNSVQSIGDYAFYECSGIMSITIPNSVTNIGMEAFFGCNSLTSVTITSNGGNAEDVKQMMIDAGVDENITWNMPS